MSKSPLFLIGTGRCGSTVLHDILTHHYQLAWPAKICEKSPDKPERNRVIMSALDLPVLGAGVRRLQYASEVYRFWDHHYRGFSRPHRDLTANDVSVRTAKHLRASFESLTTRNRSRVLMKTTGYPRVGFIAKVFPDAKFVHILRDGRATTWSDICTPWCDVWSGPYGWSWGELSDAQMATWREYKESFLILAALLWEKLMHHYELSKSLVPESQFLELTYEQMCAQPAATLRKIVEFAELDWSQDFEASVASFELKEQNAKWRIHLTTEQQTALTDSIYPTLQHYGYV